MRLKSHTHNFFFFFVDIDVYFSSHSSQFIGLPLPPSFVFVRDESRRNESHALLCPFSPIISYCNTTCAFLTHNYVCLLDKLHTNFLD